LPNLERHPNKYNPGIGKTEDMKTQKTIYHLIVDRSGSMGDCIPATVEGFNGQLAALRRMEEEFPEQEISVGLTLFNNRVDCLFDGRLVAECPELDQKSYRPDGSTALWNAIGMTILKLEAAKADSEKVLPTTVVVAILTDGYENASRQFRLAEVKERIAALSATGQWTFSFLGAGLDAAEVAESMSIRRSNSQTFFKSDMRYQVWDNLNSSMRDYFDKKRDGEDLGDLFDGKRPGGGE
jgi:hypothetical protein